MIGERRRDGGPDDLLAMLLAAPEDDVPASTQEIRDQVATIFTAGHETTANALAWTFYLLSQHPADLVRLEDELDRVTGDRPIAAEDVPHRPDQFRPDRFTSDQVAARPRFAYLPFGAGPHICIGAAFAITEAILCLAILAKRFRLTLVPGTIVEPVGLITLRPRLGLQMRIERR